MKWVYNERANRVNNEYFSVVKLFNKAETEKVKKYHQSFREYSVTPLRRLSHLAKHLGVAEIFVKDEAYRFELNAFKVLGGTYAMGKYLAERIGCDVSEVTFNDLHSDTVKKHLGELTFISATDGNHGRGVAWAANKLGQKAVIYLPAGALEIRLEHIRATGAKVLRSPLNYDETVRLCVELAEKNGWVMMQDTAWDGYTDIPTWIMQGYLTMAQEAIEQLMEFDVKKPTHIFVQAGVGSYAAAVQGYFASMFGNERPLTGVIEPNKADCFYQSVLSGKPVRITGDLDTMMAGLACGEPNPIAWNILSDYSELFVSCSENVAARGMRVLGNPLGNDPRIIAGESGAVTLGFLYDVMRKTSLQQLRKQLKLDSNSHVLLFNTEGDTDPVNYRKVVWEGE